MSEVLFDLELAVNIAIHLECPGLPTKKKNTGGVSFNLPRISIYPHRIGSNVCGAGIQVEAKRQMLSNHMA